MAQYNQTNGMGQRNAEGGRTIQELEADLMTMWSLVSDLGEQLSSNRALAESLKSRASEVKGQAVHTGTGFPLRRYNVDIADEQFTTELEKFASHLVLENQNLQYENKQLSLLLKECEGTLEGVMARFRSVSHAATQHELSLHSYYTSIIAQLQTSHSSATLLDSTNLSTLLTRLSELIRAALRSVNGEDTTREDEALLPPGFAENQAQDDARLPDDLRGMLSELEEAGKSLRDEAHRREPTSLTSDGTMPLPMRGSENTNDRKGETPSGFDRENQTSLPATIIADASTRTNGLPTRNRGRQRVPSGLPSTIGRWMGDAGINGGYYGTEGRADWALEREGEIQRLEEENQMLRKLLGVDLELISAAGPTEETEEDQAAVAAAKEEGRRQSEEIQAMRMTGSGEQAGLFGSGDGSPTTPRRTFAQSMADGLKEAAAHVELKDEDSSFRASTVSGGTMDASDLSTSPRSTLGAKSDLANTGTVTPYTIPKQDIDLEKVSAMGSTAHLEDVPLEDVIFSSPEEEAEAKAARSPPRNQSPVQAASPRYTAPPSPMLATSPTFSRTQTMPSSLSRSPKASTGRISMLSPTNSKTSLPSLGSPQSSASSRGAAGSESSSATSNPLASIFVKPKTDPTTATTTSADPALEMGEMSSKQEGGGSPQVTRSLSSPVNGGLPLGLGFPSVPSPLGSPVSATNDIRRSMSSPGAVPTSVERKAKDEIASNAGTEAKVEHLEES